MAEPTESRTNKAFIIPDEQGGPPVDPSSSDLSYDSIEAIRASRASGGDTSYDAVEATRAGRAASGADANASAQAQADTAGSGLVEADTSYDQIEALRAGRVAGSDAESFDEKHEALADRMDAIDVPDSAPVVDDITPGNYP